MSYTLPTAFTGPFPDENSQKLLYRIAAYLAAVASGSTAASTRPYQRAAAPSSSSIQTAGGDVFTLAAGETGFIRQLGTNPLFFKYGTGATSSDFTDVLSAGTANDNGTGAAVVIEDFIGTVSVAGTSPRFIAWKR